MLKDRDHAGMHMCYTLCVHPSRKCNLKCKYCFAHSEKNLSDYLPSGEISFEVIKDAIDFLTKKMGPEANKYCIDIAGSGEPLLNIELIQKLSEYCLDKSNELSKDIYIMFPTNATMLNEKTVKTLESMPNVLLGVSLDGNRRHSSNRIFANGDESFDRAIKGTKLLTKPFGIAVTITKTNEDVDEVYDYLYNSFPKCDAISMQQVRGMDDDNPMSFTNIDIDNMLYHYDLLVKKMYRCAEMKEYDYIFKLLRGSDFFGRYIRNILHPNMLYKYRCDAARSRISVDDKGDIYSCSVMNGNIDFKIGNIYSGISECARKKFLDAQVDNVETCSKCDEKYICGGECLAKAYLKSNKVDEPVEELCNLRKELIAKARSFVESIKINLPEAYYEFQKFTIDPTLLDTSAWAIKKILREFGKEISFRELYSKMEYDRMGASLSILERKINEYGIELLARQLEDEQELNEIIVPAIAWQNRFTKAYRYIVIKKICDNNVVLEDASMENEFVMSTKDFFAKVSNVIFEVREKVEGVNELEWRDKCKET